MNFCTMGSMRDETPERKRPLRHGYTTGACATAVSLAAARCLLAGDCPRSVEITLPRGERVAFRLEYCRPGDGGAVAATIKDAGDDPDVTHGALILARVRRIDRGIVFLAGEGVGTVTRPGLPVAPGEPAINPVPRRMMSEHLWSLARDLDYAGGFEVTVGIEGGEALAERTMNPRLGIVGGLSILGTTGIVRPFSCSAHIASIHQAMDVARANGIEHIAACTGSSSERAIRGALRLPDMALIEMGDFAGAVLKYLRKVPFPRVTLAAGFGKLCKLAAGHLDLHSRASAVDFAFLAKLAGEAGADDALRRAIAGANTSVEALSLAGGAGVDLAGVVCGAALAQARRHLPGGVSLEVVAVDRGGGICGRSG